MTLLLGKKWKQKTIDEKLNDISEFQIYSFGMLMMFLVIIGIKLGMV